MEDITDAGYMHSKRVCKNFEIKNLCEYHELYLKSDTLKNFRKMLSFRSCIIFFSSWISMASGFKED